MSEELTIEKLRIVQHLNEIQGQLTQILDDHKAIKSAIMGDGSDGRPGIIIDLDRLKQNAKEVVAHRRIIYSAIVGLLTERIWRFFIGK